MRIAAEESASMDLRTEGLELAVRLYEELAAMGCENDGTQALLKLIDKSCQDS